MAVGRMRKTVIFRTNNPVSASTGGQTDNYSDALTTRGELRKKSGDRELSFAEITNTESYELKVRFQSALNAILRTDLKAVIDGKTFTVSSWTIKEEIKKYFLVKLNLQQ